MSCANFDANTIAAREGGNPPIGAHFGAIDRRALGLIRRGTLVG